MARICKAPIPAPKVDYNGDWRAQEQAYIEALKVEAKKANPNDKLAGEVVRYGVADGAALYMVWTSKPLQLLHIALGDAYRLRDFAERGLRLRDVKGQLDWERKWRVRTA